MTDFNLIPDERGGLTLQRPGTDDATSVTLRRAFPWSNPGRHISVRSSDGKELLLIDDIKSLAPNQRQFVADWLGRHSFIPKISRVIKINMDFGYQQWSVETDRGPKEFRVQEREDVRFLHDGRFSVKDADGNIYELSALNTLDHESRRAIELLL